MGVTQKWVGPRAPTHTTGTSYGTSRQSRNINPVEEILSNNPSPLGIIRMGKVSNQKKKNMSKFEVQWQRDNLFPCRISIKHLDCSYAQLSLSKYISKILAVTVILCLLYSACVFMDSVNQTTWIWKKPNIETVFFFLVLNSIMVET